MFFNFYLKTKTVLLIEIQIKIKKKSNTELYNTWLYN